MFNINLQYHYICTGIKLVYADEYVYYLRGECRGDPDLLINLA